MHQLTKIAVSGKVIELVHIDNPGRTRRGQLQFRLLHADQSFLDHCLSAVDECTYKNGETKRLGSLPNPMLLVPIDVSGGGSRFPYTVADGILRTIKRLAAETTTTATTPDNNPAYVNTPSRRR